MHYSISNNIGNLDIFKYPPVIIYTRMLKKEMSLSLVPQNKTNVSGSPYRQFIKDKSSTKHFNKNLFYI